MLLIDVPQGNVHSIVLYIVKYSVSVAKKVFHAKMLPRMNERTNGAALTVAME